MTGTKAALLVSGCDSDGVVVCVSDAFHRQSINDWYSTVCWHELTWWQVSTLAQCECRFTDVRWWWCHTVLSLRRSAGANYTANECLCICKCTVVSQFTVM